MSNNNDFITYDSETEIGISKEEWLQLSHALESFHAVFYRIWQMGKPSLTNVVSTACVKFDEQGEFFEFCFNPNFWKELEFKNKLFVICHEALHVILNHGKRSIGTQKNSIAANMCMDIVVNHMLIRSFGFTKEDLKDWRSYCWLETVFPDCDFSDEETFEFYYNQFKDIYRDGLPGSTEKDCNTVDDHSYMTNDWDQGISNLDEVLAFEEKKSLQNIIEKFGEESSRLAGEAQGQWHFKKEVIAKPKKKWESVIISWTKNRLKYDEKELEQWNKLNRRLAALNSNLLLPSNIDFDDFHNSKDKIEVWFFLDTSGSCFHLSDRFLSAAASIPKKRFDVRLFCFDTFVAEIDLKDAKFYGGGGTSFHILEEKILKETAERLYPDAVFVITDGFGTNVNPKFPQRWHWFLTKGGSKTCINAKCKIYNLDDYE